MTFTPEQWTGARHLAERSVAMIADRMGFGKTAQLARALDIIGAEVVTIVVPRILAETWRRELSQWLLFSLPVHVMQASHEKLPVTGVVIVSYSLVARRKVRDKLRRRGCDVLILDESHKTKDPKTKCTKYLFGEAGVFRTAKRVWFSTGTPCPNGVHEYFVFAKVAGVWAGEYDQDEMTGEPGFIQRYCVLKKDKFKAVPVGTKEENRLELLNALGPLAIARQGVDPNRGPLTTGDIFVRGDKPLVLDIDPATLARIEAAIAAGDWSILDDPIVATARRLVSTAKAPGIAEIARGYSAERRKTLIFMHHTDAIDACANALRPEGVAVIDGRVKYSDRQPILDAFQFGEDIRNLVVHMRTGCEGLTLTAATRVLLDPDWNPANNAQAIARAWRRGQTEAVHASYCILPDSFDERVIATARRKAADTELLQLGVNYENRVA